MKLMQHFVANTALVTLIIALSKSVSAVTYSSYPSSCTGTTGAFSSTGGYLCLNPLNIRSQSGTEARLSNIVSARSIACSESNTMCAVAGEFVVELFSVANSRPSPITSFNSISPITQKALKYRVVEWIHGSEYLLAGSSTSSGLLRLNAREIEQFHILKLSSNRDDNEISRLFNVKGTRLALTSFIGTRVIHLIDVITMVFLREELVASEDSSMKPKLFSEVQGYPDKSWIVVASGDVKVVKIADLSEVSVLKVAVGAGFHGVRGYKNSDITVAVTFDTIYFFGVDGEGKLSKKHSEGNKMGIQTVVWSEGHKQLFMLDKNARPFYFSVFLTKEESPVQICHPACKSCTSSFSDLGAVCECSDKASLKQYVVGSTEKLGVCEIDNFGSFKEGAVQTFGVWNSPYTAVEFQVEDQLSSKQGGNGTVQDTVGEDKDRSPILKFIFYTAIIAVVSLIGYLAVSQKNEKN